MFEVEHLVHVKPVGLHVTIPAGTHYQPPFDHRSFVLALQPVLALPDVVEIHPLMLEWRGVGVDRLDVVLREGIDVEPSTAPFYSSSFDKAWEYGGFPKLMLGLDPRGFDRTWREIPADTPIDDLNELRETFPTMLTSEDGTKHWLSKPREGDGGICNYEIAYGHWIPGNARDFLKIVVVFSDAASFSDLDRTRATQ